MAKKTKTLPVVRVTPLEYERVVQFSREKDLPIGEIIRLAVNEYCQDKEITHDEKILDDLIKTVKKLPSPDLQEVLDYAIYRLKKSKT